jgi:hypothetical protein
LFGFSRSATEQTGRHCIQLGKLPTLISESLDIATELSLLDLQIENVNEHISPDKVLILHGRKGTRPTSQAYVAYWKQVSQKTSVTRHEDRDASHKADG